MFVKFIVYSVIALISISWASGLDNGADIDNLAQTTLLAHSAVIDGTINDGEWSPLGQSENLTSYAQWADGYLYLAARFLKTENLVITIDGNADGWLKGNDNMDIRVTPTVSNQIAIRTVDNNQEAPTYVHSELLNAYTQFVMSEDEDYRVIELRLPSLPDYKLNFNNGSTFGLRFDIFSSDTPERPAYEPRITQKLSLIDMQKPSILGPEINFKLSNPYVSPGDIFWLTVELKNKTSDLYPLKQVNVAGKGTAREWFNVLENRSEPISSGKSSKVEYKTTINSNIPYGTYLFEIIIETLEGSKQSGYSAVTVGPPIVISTNLKSYILKPDKNNKISFDMFIDARTQGQLKGGITIIAPPSFNLKNSESRTYLFPRPGLRLKQKIEAIVPVGTTGLYKFTLSASYNNGSVNQDLWIWISP